MATTSTRQLGSRMGGAFRNPFGGTRPCWSVGRGGTSLAAGSRPDLVLIPAPHHVLGGGANAHRAVVLSVLVLVSSTVPGAFLDRLRAQFDANLGRIVGEVTGPEGGLIPEAEIVAVAADSGARRTVRTDGYGQFRIGSLRPGEYSVTAASPDFAAATVDGIAVSVGGAVRVDLQMDLERTYTEIEVSAAMIDAMLPASSNVVGDRVFNDLPINGRRFHDFALLTPGVQVSRAAGHLSFGAQRGIYTNVSVDGTDYNQAFFGGIQGGERAGSAMTLPQSAIQEFQAVTSGFTAEYGRTTSGVVNVSTKSGSNEFHGDAFYQRRHPRLGLRDPFGARTLEDLRQFGGSAGGPLKKDAAFWFFAVERQDSSSPRYVEFPLLDTADRSRGPEAFDLFQSLEQPFEATNDAVALTPRFDYQFGGGSQFMTRYNYSRGRGVNAVSIGDPKHPRTVRALSNNGTEEDVVHFLTGQLTSVLGPNLVNQFRFTLTREERPRHANSAEPVVGTNLGSFGTRSFLPTTETDIRPLVNNSVMLHAGSHDIKVGGEIDHVWIDDVFGYNQYGTFRVFSSDPDEILDILTPGGQIANRFDAPGLYFRQMGNTVGVAGVGHAALYAQDSWRAAPGLTLDLGFRWEAQFNAAPQLGNTALIDQVRATDFLFGSVDPTFIPDSTRQWMPRAGFAYSPSGLSGRLVLRGSAGVFYAVTPPVFFNAATKSFRDPPFNLSVALPTNETSVYRQFLAAGIDLNQYPLNGLPAFSREEIATVLDGDPYLGAAPWAVHRTFRNPRSVKYSLALEYGLTGNMLVGMQWMRHLTSMLHGQRDYNLPSSQLRPEDPAQVPYYDTGKRPAPRLGPMFVVESIGRADYHGVTTHWKYRGDRIQLVAHYTYARAYSSDANEGYFWSPLYTDHARPDDEYGPSDLDLRHQLTSHAVIDLPWGIVWSAILRVSSGPPFSPAAGLDLNGDQFAADRALEAPGRHFGRNSFRDRGMRNLDIRVLRQFRVSETSRIELSAELFNALDVDNVEYGTFNQIYGPGVDLATGWQANPRPSFRRLRTQDGEYDRNNAQVYGTGPLQMQVGIRFFF